MDKEFLKKLDAHKNREIFARIISLDFQENPVEKIEGRVTGGSINIDGASAVRRTCSLSMVAKEMNINDFYWGLNTKFKLEIGLKNIIDIKYPDIIWFPQGVYVITSFNTSQSTNNYTVSISGKDKMCLLNGEVGGNLPASVDFGVEEFHDLVNNTTTYKKIPIKQIIREALHTYALEPYHNIIIDDLEAAGLELMEYRGEDYIYFIYNEDTEEYENIIFDGSMKCWLKADGSVTNIGSLPYYFKRVDELINAPATKIKLENSDYTYSVARFEYGDAAGYRITDLVYAGELISSIGETLTSILDKIKNMLGEYEYFYDLDGRFIFQKKRNYINSSYNSIINSEDGRYAANSAYHDPYIYTFEGGNLITAYQNTPNLTNLKNDYSIWGVRKGVSGAEIPIHLRYAIDNKPAYYKSVNITDEDIHRYIPLHRDVTQMKTQESKEYTIAEWDWREIIYQMARDYYQYGQLENFISKVIEANGDLYPNGKTGYEQYYIDIQGFWRQLYNPQADMVFNNFEDDGLVLGELSFSIDPKDYPYGLFIKQGFVKYDPSQEEGKTQDQIKALREKVFVASKFKEDSNQLQMQPLLNSIEWELKVDESNEQIGNIIEGEPYVYRYVITREDGYTPILPSFVHRVEKEQIFVGFFDEENNFKDSLTIPLINFVEPQDNWYVLATFEDNENAEGEYYNIENYLIQYPELNNLYKTADNKYYNYYPEVELDIYGQPVENGKIKRNYIKYYDKQYNYLTAEDINVDNIDPQYLHWNKSIVDAPETLSFWMDFLDTEGELNQFAIPVVGNRSKVINDKDVKSIYFKEVPEVIYIPQEQDEFNYAYDLIEQAGYWNYKILRNIPENYFTISAQGKSAFTALEELLYNYSYCIENINLTAVPIYHLEPNTRIYVKDDSSKINGEYLVSRISIPLIYNGTMTVTATKAPIRLY